MPVIFNFININLSIKLYWKKWLLTLDLFLNKKKKYRYCKTKMNHWNTDITEILFNNNNRLSTFILISFISYQTLFKDIDNDCLQMPLHYFWYKKKNMSNGNIIFSSDIHHISVKQPKYKVVFILVLFIFYKTLLIKRHLK